MPVTLDCLLIADDLTGACDAAVHFAMHGLHPAVALVQRNVQFPPARVLALNTESRDLFPEEIRVAMAAVAAEFPAGAAARIFKKIDSTLRGHVGVEIAAAVEAFECNAAIACPAFPGTHRVVEEGWLRVTNAADFSAIDVAQRLASQSGQTWTHTRPEGVTAVMAGGARFVSVDANCDRDLDLIAATLLPLGRRILWAGSAGLASALARMLGTGRSSLKAARPGAALFCIGSDHPVTLAQQSYLLAERRSVLFDPRDATRDTICNALADGTHAILRIPRGMITLEGVRERIIGAPAAGLVLSGGDTASLVCRAAGVRYIELCDEIVAGVPLGILHGGEFDGIPVVTKSGGFGDRDALIPVADYFACPNRI